MSGPAPAKVERPSWPNYFIGLAHHVGLRGTCPRRHVGCVIVKDKQILVTGYNGSIPGMPHCDDVGCAMVDGHCVRTVHAEANALMQAARQGIQVKGATAYVTLQPCWSCLKLLVTAGIDDVFFAESYGSYPAKVHVPVSLSVQKLEY